MLNIRIDFDWSARPAYVLSVCPPVPKSPCPLLFFCRLSSFSPSHHSRGSKTYSVGSALTRSTLALYTTRQRNPASIMAAIRTQQGAATRSRRRRGGSGGTSATKSAVCRSWVGRLQWSCFLALAGLVVLVSGQKDLYEVLGLGRGASSSEIK